MPSEILPTSVFHADAMAGKLADVQKALKENPDLLCELDEKNFPVFYWAKLGNKAAEATLDFLFAFAVQYIENLHATPGIEAKIKIANYYFVIGQYYYLTEAFEEALSTFKESEDLYIKVTQKANINPHDLYFNYIVPIQILRSEILIKCLAPSSADEIRIKMYSASIKILLETREIFTSLASGNDEKAHDEVFRQLARHYFAISEIHKNRSAKFMDKKDFRSSISCALQPAISNAEEAVLHLKETFSITEADEENFKKYRDHISGCRAALDTNFIKIDEIMHRDLLAADNQAAPAQSIDSINNFRGRIGPWACGQTRKIVSYALTSLGAFRVRAPAQDTQIKPGLPKAGPS